MKLTKGKMARFVAAQTNITVAASGYRTVPITKAGKPLQAGEVGIGDTLTVDLTTGAVLKHSKARRRKPR